MDIQKVSCVGAANVIHSELQAWLTMASRLKITGQKEQAVAM